tara:strand:+ start:147 stop:743 length:597 start_codon:yes stop_codon:yes gene_type:complete
MVMKALKAGGMKVAYDNRRENDLEFPLSVQWSSNFPPLDFDGHAVKIFPPPWGGLLKLPASSGGYKICWVDRPADERWDSFLRLQNKLWKFKNLTEMHQEIKKSGMDFDYFDHRALEAMLIMEQRRDVKSIVKLRYNFILDHALEAFEMLRAEEWPVQPIMAAAVPDKRKKGTGSMGGNQGQFSPQEVAFAQRLKGRQ